MSPALWLIPALAAASAASAQTDAATVPNAPLTKAVEYSTLINRGYSEVHRGLTDRELHVLMRPPAGTNPRHYYCVITPYNQNGGLAPVSQCRDFN